MIIVKVNQYVTIVNAPGHALIQKNVSILTLGICDHHTPFALVLLDFLILSPLDLPVYAKDDHN
jgi:hypothetical protein